MRSYRTFPPVGPKRPRLRLLSAEPGVRAGALAAAWREAWTPLQTSTLEFLPYLRRSPHSLRKECFPEAFLLCRPMADSLTVFQP
jgi:hypothetical protein